MIQSSVKDDEQMMGRGLVDATNLWHQNGGPDCRSKVSPPPQLVV